MKEKYFLQYIFYFYLRLESCASFVLIMPGRFFEYAILFVPYYNIHSLQEGLAFMFFIDASKLSLTPFNFLGINETPHMLEQSFKATTKLKRKLPTNIETERVPFMKLSSLAGNIHVTTREALQNTDLDMSVLLCINKTWQTI